MAQLDDTTPLTTSGSTILLSGLLEMYDRFLRNAIDRWPLMVIVTSDGEEGSAAVDTAKFTAAAQDMQMKDVIVHAVVLSVMGQGLEVQISNALTQATAGHYDSISAFFTCTRYRLMVLLTRRRDHGSGQLHGSAHARPRPALRGGCCGTGTPG